MKRRFLNSSLAAILFLSVSVSGIPAQTTTVQPVQGPGGQILPSASGILNPRITEGRFGTSLQGGYIMPNPNSDESRFSSNAIFGPSGEFIGMRSDRDAANSLPQNPQDGGELSEVDRLLLMRHLRRQAAAQQTAEETLVQRSAIPYSGPLPYTTPEPAADEPVRTAETLPPPPPPAAGPAGQSSSPQPSEEIWMRGSSRYAAPSPSSRRGNPSNSDAVLMIDPRWFEFGGGDLQTPPAPEAGANASSPAPAESPEPLAAPEEGMVVGSLLSEESQAPAASLPSDILARNGRQERRQTAALQQRLETLLLQSPLVSPLAPIHVKVNGASAVVAGVVGSESARVEAGKILLDNGIESVDNRIVVYSDNSTGDTPPNGPAENAAPFEIGENGAGDLVPAPAASESGEAR